MKRVRDFWRAARRRSSPGLSPELRQRLAERRFGVIQGEVQRLLAANPSAPEFELLRSEVRNYDWSALQIDKLEAFGDFYRGHLTSAFERARPYCRATPGHDFDADLFILTVLCLFFNHQYEDAYRLLAQSAAYEDQLAARVEYQNIKGSICMACARLDEARIAMDAARRLDPNDPLTALNAYILYFELGDLPKFAQLRAEIAANRYGSDGHAFTLATCELALGHYDQGFQILERRYAQPDAKHYVNPALPAPRRWQGRPGEFPSDGTLLLTCEQGVGDNIMMMRYLPLLRERLKRQFAVETHPETLPLLRHNFADVAWVERQHGVCPPIAFDHWIGAMSLPYLFRSGPGRIPATAGYLTVPPEHRNYWSHRVEALASPGQPRIGLAWSGNPLHRHDRRRSIPFDLIGRQLASCGDTRFFALQTRVPARSPAHLITLCDELITFADTAALIAELDLIITVDTSIVHLAGALGKPAWLLLPYRYEWRWGLEGETNDWYDSVRVLRQTRTGDWEGLLDEVFGRRLPAFMTAARDETGTGMRS